MEKEIFDTITDYIFSTQALIDRINRMYSVKLEGHRITDSVTHLSKRIDRVELEQTKLISIINQNSVSFKINDTLSKYMIAVDILIDYLEFRKGDIRKGDIRVAINRIEFYEDKLLQELKKDVKQSELEKFIDDWFPVFRHFKIPPQLMNRFRKECEEKEFKLINVLESMIKRQNLEG